MKKVYIGQQGPSDFISVGLRKNIDDFAEPSECNEIVAPTILDYVPFVERATYIQYLTSKLRHGGTLTIGGTDIISIALGVFNKTIAHDVANQLIYGSENEPPKVSLSSLEELRKLILGNGLKITQQIPGVQMLICAVRP